MQQREAKAMGVSILVAVGVGCSIAAVSGGPVPAGRLVDGEYRGSAWNGPVYAAVVVVVEDQAIREIEFVRHGTWWGAQAEAPIRRAILEQQSTHVDAVSGATISSTAIMNAVQEAVGKATR